MQRLNIAHNMTLVRGHHLDVIDDTNNNMSCLRALLWPRKHAPPVKDYEAFNVAVAELSGHLVCKHVDFYQSITERVALDRIAETALNDDDFHVLLESVRNALII